MYFDFKIKLHEFDFLNRKKQQLIREIIERKYMPSYYCSCDKYLREDFLFLSSLHISTHKE